MRLLLALSCLASACTTSTSTNDLADLNGKKADVQVINGSDGSHYLSVMIRYDSVATATENGCAALAVDATINGVAFTDIQEGGWKSGQGLTNTGSCEAPMFATFAIPSGPATIELGDASGKIEIDVSDLTTNHGFAFAAPTPSFRPGDTLTFVPSIGPAETLGLASVRATTPAALVVVSDGTYCGVPMFEGDLTRSGADFTYRAPDVYTQWQGTACNEVLTKGSPAPADLEATLVTVPTITTCQGADTCEASVSTTTALHASFVP